MVCGFRVDNGITWAHGPSKVKVNEHQYYSIYLVFDLLRARFSYLFANRGVAVVLVAEVVVIP